MSTVYDTEFWTRRATSAEMSARVCASLIYELLKPKSVVDVGCGQGHWLREFKTIGVDDILGIDGPYVLQDDRLLIPNEQFVAHDLAKPFKINRRFDLALSCEVAEHLPPSCGEIFVESLTSLSSVIVFSAALPGQGGVGHLNEQWPWYWEDLFRRKGYVRLDPLRKEVWQNSSVASWYQQNLFVYVEDTSRADLVSRWNGTLSGNLTLISLQTLAQLSRGNLWTRALRKFKRTLGLHAP